MKKLKAEVRNGRLVLDEPTNLPEGTVLHLVVDDAGDERTDEEQELLHAELIESWEQAKAGHSYSVEEVLIELRARK